MATAKYDPDVDFSNENLSQTLLALLVGSDRAVLDVGCATGYLAAMLRSRGCRVDGIEYDATMAERALEHVDRLEVGDVQAMDLVTLFGAQSYDAVVFGDVLEHLTQPLEVLRSSLALLKPGGAVVASLPNVAHGSVRLSLLAGQFTYTPTGLLDETHVHFFTRESVLEMFADAGLAVVDLRRTTAELFETEVPLRRGDFSDAAIDLVSADPESTTYQYVLRAVPVAEADPAAVLAVEQAEAERAALRSVRAAGASDPVVALPSTPSARVGLWGSWDVDDLSQALLGRVASAELARRLPGVLLRFAAPYGSHGGLRTGLGEPVEDLGPAGTVRDRALERGLDAALVVGPVDTSPEAVAARYTRPTPPDSPVHHLVQGPPGLLVLWGPVQVDGGPTGALAPGAAPGAPLRPLPDPGLLASRVLPLEVARRRVAYLRSAGFLALSDRVIAVHLSGDQDSTPVVAALAPLLDADRSLTVVALELDTTRGDGTSANLVCAALGSRARLCPVDAGIDNVLALLASVDVVVSSSPTARAVAASYGVPAVQPDAVGLASVEDLLDRPVQRRAPIPTHVPEGQAELDRWFDEVADQVRSVVRPEQERAFLSVGERYAAMERAHATMRARTSTEVLQAAESVQPVVPEFLDEVLRLRAELEALYATRTLRALKPMRDVYSRARTRLR